MSDGQVIFEITADGKHAIASVKDVTKAIESESKKWDKSVDDTTDDMTNSFSSMAKKVVAGLTAAKVAQTLFEWGKAAISAASDLREVQNVVDVTFGESASAIEAWAKKAGEQFGLTETQAKKFTSTLGAMAKSAGLSGDEIVTMSTDLAGLAADMASFYNLDFETAFQKIRSGISGETEPLKQLGVNMSVANLEAFALQKGLQKTFSEMNQGEQVMLRYQYIMQATADAQGDFARTSDGYANASRRVETALETVKTKLGNLLLEAVEPATAGLASFLEQLTTEPEHTILDDFRDIDLDTSNKLAELAKVDEEASKIIGVLKDIETKSIEVNGKTISLNELFVGMKKIEDDGGDVTAYLDNLGVSIDDVALDYRMWKDELAAVERVIPGVTDKVLEQEGALDSVSSVIEKNKNEFIQAEEAKAMWAAYYAKQRRLLEEEDGQYQRNLIKVGAESAEKMAKESLEAFQRSAKAELAQSYDFKFGFAPDQVTPEERAAWEERTELVKKNNEATATANEARKKYNDAVKDGTKAEQELEFMHKGLIETYGELEQAETEATDAAQDYLDVTSESWAERTAEAQEALTALADYVQAVREATAAQVDNAVSGFTMMKTAKQQNEEAANALEDLKKQLEEAGKTDTEIKLTLDAKNAQITLNQLNESLQSQLDYMREYQENLQKARDLGVNENLLADLSDGSNESARQLYAIVEAYQELSDTDAGGVPADIEELNRLYEEVSKEKENFTDSLTQQKLAVDKTYDDMVQRALTAVEELDVGEEAAGALERTVEGIAEGIQAGVPSVAAAVDEVLAQLDRLSSYGIGFGFGGGGLFLNYHGSHEAGLDYVPFDGYLAKLHEGEGILKAEENRVWQQFKAGQRGATVDYDALGGVMRDNVRAGGNVYLDGRAVGQVVSQIQGNQYRNLTRSGWQQ